MIDNLIKTNKIINDLSDFEKKQIKVKESLYELLDHRSFIDEYSFSRDIPDSIVDPFGKIVFKKIKKRIKVVLVDDNLKKTDESDRLLHLFRAEIIAYLTDDFDHPFIWNITSLLLFLIEGSIDINKKAVDVHFQKWLKIQYNHGASLNNLAVFYALLNNQSNVDKLTYVKNFLNIFKKEDIDLNTGYSEHRNFFFEFTTRNLDNKTISFLNKVLNHQTWKTRKLIPVVNYKKSNINNYKKKISSLMHKLHVPIISKLNFVDLLILTNEYNGSSDFPFFRKAYELDIDYIPNFHIHYKIKNENTLDILKYNYPNDVKIQLIKPDYYEIWTCIHYNNALNKWDWVGINNYEIIHNSINYFYNTYKQGKLDINHQNINILHHIISNNTTKLYPTIDIGENRLRINIDRLKRFKLYFEFLMVKSQLNFISALFVVPISDVYKIDMNSHKNNPLGIFDYLENKKKINAHIVEKISTAGYFRVIMQKGIERIIENGQIKYRNISVFRIADRKNDIKKLKNLLDKTWFFGYYHDIEQMDILFPTENNISINSDDLYSHIMSLLRG